MTKNIEKICSECSIKFIEDRSKWPIIMQLVGSNPPKPLCLDCINKEFKSFMGVLKNK